MAGEARPGLEIGIKCGRIAAREGNQIAGRRSSESCEQIQQQSRSKRTIAGVEFDVRGEL